MFEQLTGPRLECLDLFEPADVGDQCFDTSTVVGGDCAYLVGGGGEFVGVQIGHQHMHAELGITARGGEADAISSTGDDGHRADGESGMMIHDMSPQCGPIMASK